MTVFMSVLLSVGVGLVLLSIYMVTSPIYKTDPVLTELFWRISKRDDLTVTFEEGMDGSHYYVTVDCDGAGRLRFWNENRWYAWASRGSYWLPEDETQNIVWNDAMPSRLALRAMRKVVGDPPKVHVGIPVPARGRVK